MSFHHFLTILAARRWTIIGTVLAAVALAILIMLVLPARYKATASVVIDFRGLDLVGGTLMPAQMLPGYLATQIDIIESRNVALKVVESLRLDQSAVAQEEFRKETAGRGSIQAWLADLLLKNLDVKPAPESSVLHISFTGRDPQFAAAIANAFAQGYITTHLELRVEPAKQTAAWFDLRAKALREEMETAQTRLSAYQKDKGIVATEERFDTESNRLEQLSLQLSQQQALTYDALIRQRQAKEFADKGGSIEQLPDVLASQVVGMLKSDLSRLEGKLKETQSRYGANHPQAEAILAEVESTRQKLRTEMAGIASSLANAHQIALRREAELRAAVEAQRARVLALKQVRDEMQVLVREADNAEKAFSATTARRTQTSLESQAQSTNVAVLNPAVEPLEPSFPRPVLTILIGIVLGLLVGVALAFAIEMVDARVRSPEDLVAGLQAPALGVIPFVRPRRPARPASAAERGPPIGAFRT
jgi:chain length determinant protein EpsF